MPRRSGQGQRPPPGAAAPARAAFAAGAHSCTVVPGASLVYWAPFGPGWFGEKSDRIYAVRYLDAEGNEHEAHAKTSLWTGVYFTEDEVVRRALAGGPTEGVLLRVAATDALDRSREIALDYAGRARDLLEEEPELEALTHIVIDRER